MNLFKLIFRKRKVIISYCFYNSVLKRHRFGSIKVDSNYYDFNQFGVFSKIESDVRHFSEPIEEEFQIIAISYV